MGRLVQIPASISSMVQSMNVVSDVPVRLPIRSIEMLIFVLFFVSERTGRETYRLCK
jgi:hypothetical protein